MFLKSSLLPCRKVRTKWKHIVQQHDRAEEAEYGGPDQIDRSQCAVHIASRYRWRCSARGNACCGVTRAQLGVTAKLETMGLANVSAKGALFHDFSVFIGCLLICAFMPGVPCPCPRGIRRQ